MTTDLMQLRRVKERYQYDPYGVVTILNGASDADAGVSDWSADANNTSDWGWVHFHQGGRYDSTTKLYSFRHRDYSPTLQRWMQEVSLAYVDGMNLYQYAMAGPITKHDPFGLQATQPSTQPTKPQNLKYQSFVTLPDGGIGVVKASLTNSNGYSHL